ncbi:MAG: efflux transporter outer membrane subunit [Gammaproteobacteria bacterium]|nr:MAG: efflux transporter outer membrane subunit [Gammaproteobacteria bacterium]
MPCHGLPRLLLPLAVALLMAGCTTVGPDFSPPETEWLEHWQPDLPRNSSQAPAPELKAALLARWWTQFNDPLLNQLMEEADRGSLDLQLAALAILENRARLAQVAGTRYPQLQRLSAGLLAGGQDTGNGVIHARQATLGFDFAWELDFWGRYRRSIESAEAGFLASLANRQQAEAAVHASVASLYFAYRTLARRIHIAQQNARLQERSLEITRAHYRSGNSSELDYQQARTQYLGTLSSIPALQQAQRETRNALAVLLGRPPGPMPELEALQETPLPDVPVEATRSLPATILLQRPDVRASLWQAAAQSARIGVAASALYPHLSIVGNVGWSSIQPADTRTTALLLGPFLSWDIFNYGRLENAVLIEDSRLQQALTRYRASVLGAAREVDDSASALYHVAEEIRLRQQAVQAARRALQISQTSYQEGFTDFQRVLDAQRNLFLQEDSLVNARGNLLQAGINFYKSLGGGWTREELPRMLPAGMLEAMRKRSDWGPLIDRPLYPDQDDPTPPPDNREQETP